MINVTIICIGKLKEKYLRDANTEYVKRLTAFCKLSIIEVSPSILPDNPSDAQILKALKIEGEKICKKIPKGAMAFAMCIEGKQRASTDLSKEISQFAINGISNVTFIIGSSFGLSEEVKKKANQSLSMSKMTFPHQLARIMLLEQIYRSFQISSGGKYHK